MKKYTVLIPFQGTLAFDLEAETPQEARLVGQQKFNNIPVAESIGKNVGELDIRYYYN